MTPSLPAVILAGGQSRRMGGGDKGLRMLGGRRIIDRVVARLAPQCGRLALNANGDPGRFGLDLPVVPDSVADWPGPLAGVLAAMDWAVELRAEWVVTAAGDTPFLPLDLVARLRGEAGPGGAVAATKGGLHPVFGLWPVGRREALRTSLNGGLRRMTDWTRAEGMVPVMFPEGAVDPFFNINTPEDLALAESLL